MRSFIRLKNRNRRRLPDTFRDDAVRYADELVELFVRRYSRPGALVFDPFAGFGTTLLVAEAMERAAWGVELDSARVAYIRGLLTHPERLLLGDARQLTQYALPPFDLCMTSPPFMERDDDVDPLTNYALPAVSYDAYLSEMHTVFTQVAALAHPGAYVVVEAANLKGESGVTTLAWDLAGVIGSVLTFEGEVVVGWDRYNYGYDHSYCLVFRRV